MQQLLEQLKIKADVVGFKTNGVMSKYYLRLQPGGKVKKIENCSNEIALGLKSYSIPIVKLIPERGLVSLEVLIKPQSMVNFNDIHGSLKLNKGLPAIIGRTYNGKNLVVDITKMPHLLVAGTTGSGKSILLHSIICSLISNTKLDIRLALIDPKNVEFTYYKDIKQLMYPVINYTNEAYAVLSDLVDEMNRRFKMMSKKSAKNINEYNVKRSKKLPYIVLIIDEFSDLMQMSKKEFQIKISNLASKARAAGIHIIIATQRPSVDIVSGTIKSNFQSRICFKVATAADSRVVLDRNDGSKLLGYGDGLINSINYDFLRFKGAYLDSKTIQNICIKNERNWLNKVINYMRKL